MHTSKFSLADLLTVLGAGVFGFFCFLSLNFLSFGNRVQSVAGAVVLALIVGGLAFGVKLIKTTKRNFQHYIVWEYIFLLLFAGVAFVATFPFSHYFSILQQRTGIQREVTTSIGQAESMFSDYENYARDRENIYKSRLNSVIAAKNIQPSEYVQYGFVNSTNDSVQVENKMFTLHAQLFPSNYEGEGSIKQTATNWLANAKNTLESKRAFTFGIVKVLKNLQFNISIWKDELKKLSAFRAQGEPANDFEYPLTFKDETTIFTALSTPTPVAISIAIGLYVLMLLSYFVSKRSTKNHYSLFWFITGKRKITNHNIDIRY